MAYQGPPRTAYVNEPFAILDDPANLRNFLTQAGIRTDDVPAGPPNSPEHGALDVQTHPSTDTSSEISTVFETEFPTGGVHITTSFEVTASPTPLNYRSHSYEISVPQVASEETTSEAGTSADSLNRERSEVSAPMTAGPNYIREIVANFRAAQEAMASLHVSLIAAGAIEDDTPGRAEQADRVCTP